MSINRSRYKIFLNSNLDFKFVLISNIRETEYYTFLQQQKSRKNLTQFLFTSKLTINLLIEMLKRKDICISDISLYDNDTEIVLKILKLFNQYKEKIIDENMIHKELDYLYDDYSIDIRSFKLYSNVGSHGALKVYVSGIFEDMDDYWNDVLMQDLNTVWNK